LPRDVPRLDLNHAGVGRGNRRARFERLGGAVGFDEDSFDHRGRGLASVNGAELVERVVDGLLHAGLRLAEDWVTHGL